MPPVCNNNNNYNDLDFKMWTPAGAAAKAQRTMNRKQAYTPAPDNAFYYYQPSKVSDLQPPIQSLPHSLSSNSPSVLPPQPLLLPPPPPSPPPSLPPPPPSSSLPSLAPSPSLPSVTDATDGSQSAAVLPGASLEPEGGAKEVELDKSEDPEKRFDDMWISCIRFVKD
ncbi:uncharacterized protein HD556DRAFT_1314859 [Suillus plorans]|uniref:Uncharacterized protein n=1 Tax=Suillus plorans TaxID=116603 RepID=A0A9P7A8Z4_9AGAM|nr:uncharacterized protein HD556DRAFT_1314859 [Suillus plorans]KAG1784684.1 hypothetical protein HD556DRAFT_1314859 [Suillus plorans]